MAPSQLLPAQATPTTTLNKYSLTEDETRYIPTTEDVKRFVAVTLFNGDETAVRITVRSFAGQPWRAWDTSFWRSSDSEQEKSRRWVYWAERELTEQEVKYKMRDYSVFLFVSFSDRSLTGTGSRNSPTKRKRQTQAQWRRRESVETSIPARRTGMARRLQA